jgi:hypothetical protein
VTSVREEKETVAMRREDLLGLVAKTIPDDDEDDDERISPIAVLAVIGMFVGLFVAIVQVS